MGGSLWHYSTPPKNSKAIGVIFKHTKSGLYELQPEFTKENWESFTDTQNIVNFFKNVFEQKHHDPNYIKAFHTLLIDTSGNLKNLRSFKINENDLKTIISYIDNKSPNYKKFVIVNSNENGRTTPGNNLLAQFHPFLEFNVDDKKYSIEELMRKSIKIAYTKSQKINFKLSKFQGELSEYEKNKAVLVTDAKFKVAFNIPEKPPGKNDSIGVNKKLKKILKDTVQIAWDEGRKKRLNDLNSRTKFVNFDSHYICDRVNDNECDVVEYKTDWRSLVNNPSNMLFKCHALGTSEFLYFLKESS